MVSIARLSVVKQSSFGLPGQFGRRVTTVNGFHTSHSPHALSRAIFGRWLGYLVLMLLNFREIYNHISLCNDGIYIFCHLVSEMQQRPSKVLEDFFLLDTGSQNNGCCLFTRAAAYARMFTVILFGYNDNFLY